METKNKVFAGLVTAALVSATTYWEGFKQTPYQDIVGVLTVCVGHTGKDIIRNKVYTKEECKQMLEKDLKVYSNGVVNCVNKPMNENQYYAFTMFAYNVGVSNFCSAGFLKEFNKGNSEKACQGMYKHPDGSPAWSFSGGKYVQGLQNRRKFESDLCLGNLKWDENLQQFVRL